MEWDDDEIRERIAKVLQMEGYTQKGFAEKVQMNKTNFNQVMLGNRKVPKALPSKVHECFPEIRASWLLYGEGEMYESEEIAKHASNVYDMMSEQTMKPRLPLNVAGNRISDYLQGVMRIACDEQPVVRQFPEYDFTILLKNDTMAPEYRRGDEIALKRVSAVENPHDGLIDTNFIEWGHEYLIDTINGPKFKIVYEDKDYFRCVSHNPEKYPDFRIPKRDVYAIYRVVGMIRV